ncbi:uncharacterized protein V1516DRAFT_680059 [Lipomyces oligophaga]|uniref:uncharacterized protein n=1 Tax=Lipomyces oligophaga TaxID=45792 RepID=UPI0034CE0061
MSSSISSDSSSYGLSTSPPSTATSPLSMSDLASELPETDFDLQSRHIPFEILELIMSLIPPPFPAALLYVSRAFYHASIKHVYQRPNLSPKNYLPFVTTISSSDIFGKYVRVLDLRFIIQSGKNSYTSRILRRCSKSVEEFYAPQTSFGYAPLISVRHCHKLRVLDLSLVCETVDLRELFLAIRNLQSLTVLNFPRSSVFCVGFDNSLWPPNLDTLGLAGGISDEFLTNTIFPHTITTLTMAHCPFIKTEAVHSLLSQLGPLLKSVRFAFPMMTLTTNGLDPILRYCPNLRQLSVPTDYITHRMLSPDNVSPGHPLEMLDLDCSGMLGQSNKIQADDIALAILEGLLPKVRIVRASIKLGWSKDDEEVSELIEVLSEKENGGLWIA